MAKTTDLVRILSEIFDELEGGNYGALTERKQNNRVHQKKQGGYFWIDDVKESLASRILDKILGNNFADIAERLTFYLQKKCYCEKIVWFPPWYKELISRANAWRDSQIDSSIAQQAKPRVQG